MMNWVGNLGDKTSPHNGKPYISYLKVFTTHLRDLVSRIVYKLLGQVRVLFSCLKIYMCPLCKPCSGCLLEIHYDPASPNLLQYVCFKSKLT